MRRHLLTVVLAVFFIDPAAAFDLPARKPGLWEITTISEYTQRTQVMQQCVDAATDEVLQERFTVGELSCPKVDIRRSGSTTIVDSSCTMGDAAKAIHAIFEGDFDSAYRVTVTRSRGSLSIQGAYRTTMTQHAKWLGPCIASQKSGDADWVRD